MRAHWCWLPKKFLWLPEVKLGAFHRYCAYSILGLLFVSGVVHFVLHQFFAVTGPFGAAPHPAEHSLLLLHGAAAMAALLLIGSLLPAHVGPSWLLDRNRRAGLALLAVVALMTLSGYGLYYLGADGLRAACRWLHIGAGLAFLPVFAGHLWRGVSTRPE